MGCGADTEANSLMSTLTTEVTFDIPDININDPKYNVPITGSSAIYGPIAKITIDKLTTGAVGGTGAFDKIMASMVAHLKVEFDKGRITGAEYTKAYIAMVESALAQGAQFLLNQETAYWAAQTAQIGAFTALINAETAKMQFVNTQFTAYQTKAEYAIAKITLATRSQEYCISKYNLENILPTQRDLLLAQTNVAQEQREAQRAQTADTRSDGATVTGVLGKQKDLYNQQITSYRRDAETKGIRFWVDAWIAMKTVDEGILPPANFQNTSLDALLTKFKTNLELT